MARLPPLSCQSQRYSAVVVDDFVVPRWVGADAVRFAPRLPGSKSQTCRALVLAAARPGATRLAGALHADDTLRLAAGLAAFGGLQVQRTDDGFVVRRGTGVLTAPRAAIDVGGGGTPARLLLAFATAADGATVITGDERLRQRPMAGLLAALRAFGIRCECLGQPDRLPVRVHGGLPTHRDWSVDASASSQFASALLLLAAQCPGPPIELTLAGPLASAPYVAMTVAMLRAHGIGCAQPSATRFVVTPGTAVNDTLAIEPDASSAAYFFALAAVTGTTVVVDGLGRDSVQGDVRFARVLAAMGCDLEEHDRSLRLTGAALRGIDVDLADMPDQVLTLAAVATCARGETSIAGIGTLRGKESDRVAAAIAGVEAFGGTAEATGDRLIVRPGPLRSGRVPTAGDHRVAMAFAVPAVLIGGVRIQDRAVVGKSFPGFWAELERFLGQDRSEAR